jgi:hypothetical protein
MKTLSRMNRASRETEAQRMHFVKAIMTSLVRKFASVMAAPKDFTSTKPPPYEPMRSRQSSSQIGSL